MFYVVYIYGFINVEQEDGSFLALRVSLIDDPFIS